MATRNETMHSKLVEMGNTLVNQVVTMEIDQWQAIAHELDHLPIARVTTRNYKWFCDNAMVPVVEITADEMRRRSGRSNATLDFDEMQIRIRKDRKNGHKLSSLFHELAHYVMHWDGEKILFTHGSSKLTEIEAESVAYIVGLHFGVDSPFSANYVNAFFSGIYRNTVDVDEWGTLQQNVMKDLMNRIVTCAQTIIEHYETLRMAGEQMELPYKNNNLGRGDEMRQDIYRLTEVHEVRCEYCNDFGHIVDEENSGGGSWDEMRWKDCPYCPELGARSLRGMKIRFEYDVRNCTDASGNWDIRKVEQREFWWYGYILGLREGGTISWGIWEKMYAKVRDVSNAVRKLAYTDIGETS